MTARKIRMFGFAVIVVFIGCYQRGGTLSQPAQGVSSVKATTSMDAADVRPASGSPLEQATPFVVGDWTGTWAIDVPRQSSRADGDAAATETVAPGAALDTTRQMDCRVVSLSPGQWQATFEGDCGRPYKYVIEMLGRQAGDVVLFQGSADLGEQDGGVYNWVGRANEKQFVGFFTSQGYTGSFLLARGRSTGALEEGE